MGGASGGGREVGEDRREEGVEREERFEDMLRRKVRGYVSEKEREVVYVCS